MLMSLLDSLTSVLSFNDPWEETIPRTDAWGTAPDSTTQLHTVHLDDWEAVHAISPNLASGPWIAGGAPLRWYQHSAVDASDIDVFCKNAVQAQQVISRIKSYGRYSTKFQSENAVTLLYRAFEGNRIWTIQIITKRYFDSIQEVIDAFDITACQIGTAGQEWIMNRSTARDIREKNLRFVEPLQPDCVKRLVKYWTYGYRPVPGTIEAVQNNPTSNWKFENAEDYSDAF
jgi:hypothetical protein